MRFFKVHKNICTPSEYLSRYWLSVFKGFSGAVGYDVQTIDADDDSFMSLIFQCDFHHYAETRDL